MPAVSLIGPAVGSEFSSLVDWIRSEFPAAAMSEFKDIQSWAPAADGRSQSQLTIVLQSWSDQFTASDVDRLVGATVFSGLLCCYGAWCEGDGRTHHIWPHSTRVSVRYARQVIQSELRRLDSARSALPPTAARDEIFLHRQLFHSEQQPGQERTTLVISPDRVYRSTLAQVLESRGWKATHLSLNSKELKQVRSPQLLIHDLDPECDAVAVSLDACRRRFPNAEMFAVANMPTRIDADSRSRLSVLPKLDPFLAVEQVEQLRHFSN